MKYNFIPNNPFYMCKSVKKVPCCNFFALYAKCFFINVYRFEKKNYFCREIVPGL